MLIKENTYFLLAMLSLIAFLFFTQKGKPFFDLILIKILLLIWFAYNIPTLIIYFNYLIENIHTKVEIDIMNNKIIISQKGKTIQYEISDIEKSVYHLGIYNKNKIDNAMREKMLNSNMAYWDLEFKNGDRYYISNLLIDFLHKTPFIENTEYRFRLFQYIKKRDSKKGIEFGKTNERNQIKTGTEKFKEKFRFKSEDELNDILKNKSKYQEEAIKAVEILIEQKTLGNKTYN